MQEVEALHLLIQELCYLSNERNKINHTRTQARWRRSYWSNALKVVEAHRGTNSKLRRLSKQKHAKAISQIEHDMAHIRLKNPRPKKWLSMGLMKIRANILKAEAEYARSKYETLVFTEKHSARNKELLSILYARIAYENGYVVFISIPDHLVNGLGKEDIRKMAEQYELNKAVEEVILDEKVLSTKT